MKGWKMPPVLALSFAILFGSAFIHDEWVKADTPIELVPVPDSVKRQWVTAARCLANGDTAWRGARVFVGGSHPPQDWPSPLDPKGMGAGGINPGLNAIWVRTLSAPTVNHQMSHMRLWGAGMPHPAFAFGQQGDWPLCGLSPVSGADVQGKLTP